MTTNIDTSATIYQFPLRGRFAMGARPSIADLKAQSVAENVVTDAWYHLEAIEESKRTGKQ